MNLYKEVTEKVLQLMEEHGSGFTLPFARMGGWPVNAATGNRYHGINTLMLGLFGGGATIWASYKQWQKVGAQVRRGEQGMHIVFYKTGNGERDNVKTGEREGYTYPILRHSSVFSSDQVDDCPAALIEKYAPNVNGEDLTERLANVDAYINNLGANVVHGSVDGAYYRPGTDTIHMPAREAFQSTDTSSCSQNYYSTFLHECTHWTGAPSRLHRLKTERNKNGYAYEELIAELGATFQCKLLAISSEPRVDHAQYLSGWIKALKSDTRFIFRAAAEAQKAVEYMDTLQEEKAAAA